MNMKQFILSLEWYLIFCFSFCALVPSQGVVERVIEGDGHNAIGGSKMGHKFTIHHTSPPTELHTISGMSLSERSKVLETFAPLNENFEYRPHSMNWFSIHPQNLIGRLTHKHERNMHELLDLVTGAQKYNTMIRSIAEKLRTMVEEYGFNKQLFIEGSGLKDIMITALEYLQQEELQTNERLWTLSILHILQSYFPRDQLKPIRQAPKTGPVSRGGLELFLTEGLDCKPRAEVTSDGKAEVSHVNRSVTEALKRVELIMTIKSVLEDPKLSSELYRLRAIHDQLLQRRQLDRGTINWIVWTTMQQMRIKSTTNAQIHCLNLILQHLETFFPITKKLLEYRTYSGETFEAIKQSLGAQAEWQYKLEKSLEKSTRVDPYIKSLLLSLTLRESFNLEYFKYCINSMNIQDSALKLKESKPEEYGLEISQRQSYYKDQDLFIQTMFNAIPHITGLKEYLQTQVKQDANTGHYQFISQRLLENKDESSKICTICQEEIIKGQEVNQLACQTNSPHLFHQECTTPMPLDLWHGHTCVRCPICRNHCRMEDSIIWK
ncbi:hypothetical protein DFH28DRAFT_305809 [Melampsora americana]|nr:hypothetical protein DFH28DRAFT_305809 [Melampsora americana]